MLKLSLKMKTTGLLSFLLLLGICGGEKKNYSGYKIIRVYPETESQWKELRELENLGFNLLSDTRQYADLLVPPQLTKSIIDDMNDGSLQMTTLIDDVQPIIEMQKVNQEPIENGSLQWDRYYTLPDIHEFLEAQSASHDTFASTFSVGKSYEGRELLAIKISKSGETKPAIWIDANIHAREWITGAVCTYIIDQLLNNDDPEIQTWLDNYDFYILPIMNPDGYVFSHTTDRFWRKSRSANGSPVGCTGTDLNRNFDYHWLENGGASNDPCSNAFAGTSVFSDSEAAGVRDFLQSDSIKDRLVFYLSLHSAGQYILFPTGFNEEKIPQYNTYLSIGKKAAEAHAVKYGTNFTAGSIYDLMSMVRNLKSLNDMYTDVATGTSMDWAKDKLKTKLTFTYELRDKGKYGHLLPPEQIYPSATEFMDGFKVIMTELANGIPDVDP